jgi:hypothetical protein
MKGDSNMSANERKSKFALCTPEQSLLKQRAEYDALLKKHTKLVQDFEEMYATLRTLAQNVDALRDRVGHTLAAERGLPESIHVDDISDGCLVERFVSPL